MPKPNASPVRSDSSDYYAWLSIVPESARDALAQDLEDIEVTCYADIRKVSTRLLKHVARGAISPAVNTMLLEHLQIQLASMLSEDGPKRTERGHPALNPVQVNIAVEATKQIAGTPPVYTTLLKELEVRDEPAE